MSKEMFSLIKNEISASDKKSTESEKSVWLLFFINNRLCALPSSSVKEILRDSIVFPLPFAPSYLNGVLNRYGDPYAVVDPAVVLGEKAQSTSLFLTLNDETHTCLRISEVKDFFEAGSTIINRFSESEISPFFDGSLTVNQEEAMILKLDSFLERLETDIENA